MKSRCPACNPIHGNGITSLRQKAERRWDISTKCFVCKGERLVDVEVSKRYVGAIQGTSRNITARRSQVIGGYSQRKDEDS